MEWIARIPEAFSEARVRLIDPGSRGHAAVAVVLHEAADGMRMLFIERAVNEHDYWSGNISFPGGRREACDPSARHTAERETLEEVGLDLGGARYLGQLPDYAPVGQGIVISSYVYFLAGKPDLTLDRREVAAAFWFPVSEFDDPARRTGVEFRFRNRQRRFPALRLDNANGQPLWGITYRLLRNLGKSVRRPEAWSALPFPLPRRSADSAVQEAA